MVRVQRPADCQGGPDDCEPPRSSTTCFPSLVSYVVRVPLGDDAQGCRRFWHSYGSAKPRLRAQDVSGDGWQRTKS